MTGRSALRKKSHLQKLDVTDAIELRQASAGAEFRPSGETPVMRVNSGERPRHLLLPTSGQILGRLVSALRLRDRFFKSGTAVRYFGGKPIGERKRRVLLRRIARSIFDTELIPLPGVLSEAEGRGKDASVLLAYFLLNRARDWDRLRGAVSTLGTDYVHPEYVVSAVLRLFVVELSIRVSALLYAAGVKIDERDHWEWVDRRKRRSLFNSAIERVPGKRPSLDEIAEHSQISDKTLDGWLYEGVRPRDDSLGLFSAYLANQIPDQSPVELELEFRFKLGIAALCDELAMHIDSSTIVDAAEALIRFVWQLTTWTQRSMPVARSKRVQTLSIGFATEDLDSKATETPITYLLNREGSWVWRNLLIGFTSGPVVYLKLVALLAGSDITRHGFARWQSEGHGVSQEALDFVANGLLLDTETRVSDVAGGDSSIKPPEDRNDDFDDTLRLVMADVGPMLRSPETSVTYVRQLLKSDPQSTFLHWRLGSALWVMGKTREAEDAFWLATCFTPDWDVPWADLIISHVRDGRYERATEIVRTAVRHVVEPGAQFNFARGVCEAGLGNFDDARVFLNLAISDSPAHGAAYDLLARIAIETDRLRDGWKFAKEAQLLGYPDTFQFLTASLE